MPLSISSSNERVPLCQYKKLWILSICLSLTYSVVAESTYRINGFIPTLNDNMTLWSYWRNQVYTSKGRKKMVIVGASRAQLGIVPKILAKEFPTYDVIHLAIDATHCYATLKDLANDLNFDGIVICSIVPDTFYPSSLNAQNRYVNYYKDHGISLNEKANLIISGKLQEKLFIMSSHNTPNSVVHNAIYRHTHYISYLNTQFNRYRPALYSTRLNAQELEEMRVIRLNKIQAGIKARDALKADDFINAVDKYISPLHDKMMAKRGAVIFVRMPESGEHWTESSRRYPKELYWDKFAKRCPAPTIHFIDYPELSKFECPDGSHLDYQDAMEFTKNLSHVIKELW